MSKLALNTPAKPLKRRCKIVKKGPDLIQLRVPDQKMSLNVSNMFWDSHLEVANKKDKAEIIIATTGVAPKIIFNFNAADVCKGLPDRFFFAVFIYLL